MGKYVFSFIADGSKVDFEKEAPLSLNSVCETVLELIGKMKDAGLALPPIVSVYDIDITEVLDETHIFDYNVAENKFEYTPYFISNIEFKLIHAHAGIIDISSDITEKGELRVYGYTVEYNDLISWDEFWSGFGLGISEMPFKANPGGLRKMNTALFHKMQSLGDWTTMLKNPEMVLCDVKNAKEYIGCYGPLDEDQEKGLLIEVIF